MCFINTELCPCCQYDTGVKTLHKLKTCPSGPETCAVVQQIRLVAEIDRWPKVICNTEECMFGPEYKETFRSKWQPYGRRSAVTAPGGTLALGDGQDPSPAGADAPASAQAPAIPVNNQPGEGSATFPTGRTRPQKLPNGRTPLPDGKSMTEKRFSPYSRPRTRAFASKLATQTPSDAARQTGPTLATPGSTDAEATCAASSSSSASRASKSEPIGPNGMRVVSFNQPSRDGNPVKTQYRSRGVVDLDELPAHHRQEIQELKARMNEKMTMQMVVLGCSTGNDEKKLAIPWILEEDKMIQLLRSRGFSYRQIWTDFLPRRSVASITVRRKNHWRTHSRGFEFVPDGATISGSEEEAAAVSAQQATPVAEKMGETPLTEKMDEAKVAHSNEETNNTVEAEEQAVTAETIAEKVTYPDNEAQVQVEEQAASPTENKTEEKAQEKGLQKGSDDQPLANTATEANNSNGDKESVGAAAAKEDVEMVDQAE